MDETSTWVGSAHDGQAGESIVSLSERLGFHKSTFYVRLAAAGIDPSRRYALRADQIKLAAQFYSQGDSLASVGKFFDVDAQTIRRALHAAGVSIRKRKGWA
jgi:hypothetical protein